MSEKHRGQKSRQARASAARRSARVRRAGKAASARRAALAVLARESDRQLDELIARRLAVPVEQRMNFLGRRLPGGGSCL